MGNHQLYEHMCPLPKPKHPTTTQEVCAHLLPKPPYTLKWPHYYSFIYSFNVDPRNVLIHSFIHSYTKVCPSCDHPCPHSTSYGFTSVFTSPSLPNAIVLSTLFRIGTLLANIGSILTPHHLLCLCLSNNCTWRIITLVKSTTLFTSRMNVRNIR